MKKIPNRIRVIVMVLTFFISLKCVMVTYAEDCETGNAQSTYFEIYDKDGNLKSEGYLPANEDEAKKEMQTRGTMGFPSRTLSNGDVMQCYQSGNMKFVVNEGDFLSMTFGLDRTAYIYSGIAEWSGIEHIATSGGLTAGRSHNGRAVSHAAYYGFIRNASTEPVTVMFANFTNPYLQ